LATAATSAAAGSAAAAVTTAAAATWGLGTRFIHGDATAIELRFVQLLDGGLCRFIGLHFDERKSPRSPGHLVAHDVHRVNGSHCLEHFLQPTLISIEREVSDEQFPSHHDSCPAGR
jgi:hypothetical protein